MNTIDIQDIKVKTDDGWFITLRHIPWNDNVELYIGQKQGVDAFIAHFDKSGQAIMKKLVEGAAEVEPTMRLPYVVWKGFKKAIQGIEETPEKQGVDAELKATKYHLEDMRKLLKIK